MDKYTPEPWKVRKDGDEYYIEILSKYSGHLCQLGSGCFSKEDARRIVACVNACAGIETETLESEGSIAEIITSKRKRIAELEALHRYALKEEGALRDTLANERAKVEMLREIISNARSPEDVNHFFARGLLTKKE